MSTRLAQARRLAGDIEDALAGVEGVLVTLDASKVAPAALRGLAVLISPPSIRWQTWEIFDAAFEVHLVAGPATDLVAAWAVLDAAIDALDMAGINLARAEPSTFKPPQPGPSIPAYSLTLHPLDT